MSENAAQRADILAALPGILREYTMQRIVQDEEAKRACGPQMRLLTAVRAFNLAWRQLVAVYEDQEGHGIVDGEAFLRAEDLHSQEIAAFHGYVWEIGVFDDAIHAARRERVKAGLLAIGRGYTDVH